MAIFTRFRLLFALLLLGVLAACGGGGGEASGSGTLRLALTDAPSCGYDEVNVTVERVRVHQSSTAADSDGGWVDLVQDPPQRVDLLTLSNGLLMELGQTRLTAGTYRQLRLVLADNTVLNPMANSVVPTGGTEVALKTPSAQQSGLKIRVGMDVATDQLADVVLDFDACKSVVKAGGSGQFLLKPVITAFPRTATGVTGEVVASLANGSTTVALQQGGVTLRSTTPSPSGSFLLQPVLPGTYTLVLTAPGRAVAVVSGVAVADGHVVRIHPAATPLDPATSTRSGTLTGTVTTALSPVDASVRVLQPLPAAVVELINRPVDGDTGQYRYRLSTAVPELAVHAGGAALAFAPVGAAAGPFTLEATATGQTQAVEAVVLGDDATATTNFVFP